MNESDIATITLILKKIPLFEELSPVEHIEIIKRITMDYYPANQIIFHENEPGDSFFIIKRGVIRIYHEAETPVEEVEVSMLADNDFFGEMSLIEDKPRNATAKCTEESEVFKLNKDDFHKLISENPGMASHISSEFLKRFKINLRAQ